MDITNPRKLSPAELDTALDRHPAIVRQDMSHLVDDEYQALQAEYNRRLRIAHAIYEGTYERLGRVMDAAEQYMRENIDRAAYEAALWTAGLARERI